MNTSQLSDQYKLVIKELQSLNDKRQFVLESFAVLNDYDIVLDSTGKYTKDTAYLAHFSPFFSSTQEWPEYFVRVQGHYTCNRKIVIVDDEHIDIENIIRIEFCE